MGRPEAGAARRAVLGLLGWAFPLGLVGGASSSAQHLGEIARQSDARRLRASSGFFDPESNMDALPSEPGATLTVAELDGPGEIRHIWCLEREKVLFGERVTTARPTVERLSAAVARFRSELGELPRELRRFSAADIYSVRGNERRPDGWIGNWR